MIKVFDKLKILFIEDSENDAVLMTHYLKSIFKEVLFTRIETKEEIELALKNEDWDIIIIDNALPQLTAFEAINQIKKMNVDKPMICTSGTELLDIKERCLEEGALAFITKNDKENFINTIVNIIKEKYE